MVRSAEIWKNHLRAPLWAHILYKDEPACVILTLLNIYPVTDLRGREGCPWSPFFFQFHALFGNIWQHRMFAPHSPKELAPPPQGNPGTLLVFIDKYGVLTNQ